MPGLWKADIREMRKVEQRSVPQGVRGLCNLPEAADLQVRVPRRCHLLPVLLPRPDHPLSWARLCPAGRQVLPVLDGHWFG